METQLTIGERIEDLIIESKKTAEQIAIESGVNKTTLSEIRNNKLNSDGQPKDFGYKSFLKLAKYFNVSVDYLLGVTNIRTPDVNKTFVCEYTGLNETAVDNLHSLAVILRFAFDVYDDFDKMLDNKYYDSFVDKTEKVVTNFKISDIDGFDLAERLAEKNSNGRFYSRKKEKPPFAILESDDVEELEKHNILFDDYIHHLIATAGTCLQGLNLLLKKENIENIAYRIREVQRRFEWTQDFDNLSYVALYKLNLYIAEMIKANADLKNEK